MKRICCITSITQKHKGKDTNFAEHAHLKLERERERVCVNRRFGRRGRESGKQREGIIVNEEAVLNMDAIIGVQSVSWGGGER